jgi:hypothetical protein
MRPALGLHLDLVGREPVHHPQAARDIVLLRPGDTRVGIGRRREERVLRDDRTRREDRARLERVATRRRVRVVQEPVREQRPQRRRDQATLGLVVLPLRVLRAARDPEDHPVDRLLR